MTTATDKRIVKKKIQNLVSLHGNWVYHVTGQQINASEEKERLYNEWVEGLITLEEINEDILRNF